MTIFDERHKQINRAQKIKCEIFNNEENIFSELKPESVEVYKFLKNKYQKK